MSSRTNSGQALGRWQGAGLLLLVCLGPVLVSATPVLPITTMLNNTLAVSPTCRSALRRLDAASIQVKEANFASGDINEGMKILIDKFLSGKKTPFELAGGFTPLDIGVRDSCVDLQDFHYCSVILGGGSIIRYGLCVPKGCDGNDVIKASIPSYLMKPMKPEITCDRGFAQHPRGLTALVAVIVFLGVLCLIGTALDYHISNKEAVEEIAVVLKDESPVEEEAAEPPLMKTLSRMMSHTEGSMIGDFQSPLTSQLSMMSVASLTSPPPSPPRGGNLVASIQQAPDGTLVMFPAMSHGQAIPYRRASSTLMSRRSSFREPAVPTITETETVDECKAAELPAAPSGKRPSKAWAFMEKFFLCFSLFRSMNTLVGPRPGAAYGCLDGIRAISVVWIILGHTFIFPTLTVGYANVNFAYDRWGWTLAAMLTRAAYLGVSTFFFLSGFLAVTLLCKHLLKLREKKGAAKSDRLVLMSIPFLCVHRWLRMLPAFVFIVSSYLILAPYLTVGSTTGPIQSDLHVCTAYWWRSVLFISNYLARNFFEICYDVSWYLDVDFQLWVTTPFFVVLGVNSEKAAYAAGSALVLAGIIFGAVITPQKELSINIFNLTAYPRYMFYYYTKPWSHLGPYYVGCLTGIFWVHRGEQLKDAVDFMSQKTKMRAVLAAAVSGLLMGLTVFTTRGVVSLAADRWSVGQMTAFIAASDAAWAAGIAIMALLLILGLGGPINTLLENHTFLVMSRLGFCTYLVHPALIYIWSANMVYPINYSDLSFYIAAFGMAVMAFALGALVFLLVEKPFGDLGKLLLGDGKGKEGAGDKKKAEDAPAAASDVQLTRVK